MNLAGESAVYRNFVAAAACSPTRAALFTGRDHLLTGVWGVPPRANLREDETRMPAFFKAAGYRTLHVGKLDCVKVEKNNPTRFGWDDWLGGGGYQHRDPMVFQPGRSSQGQGWTADLWTEHTLDSIREHRDEPWFASIAYFIPHLPWVCEEKYSAPFVAQGCSKNLASVSSVGHVGVGQLVRARWAAPARSSPATAACHRTGTPLEGQRLPQAHRPRHCPMHRKLEWSRRALDDEPTSRKGLNMFRENTKAVGINRRSFLSASAAAGVAASLTGKAGGGQSPAPPPKPGQPRKLLFWDLARFDYWDNVELVQGRGVYRPEATFEDPDGRKGRVIFPSVWKEPTGRWRAVYGKNWRPFPICALESDDGLRWRPLPVPETVPTGGKIAPHHVFTLEAGSGSGVYHDPIAADGYPLKIFGRQDGEPVYQRALKNPNHVWHKIARTDGVKRYMAEGVTLGSRDGIHWELLPGGTWSRPDWFPEDPVFAFYNRHLARHVMIVRPGCGDRRVCWRETTDFKQWGPPELLFQPDPLDDAAPLGFYTMPVFPYEQGYVGLLWVFHYSNSEPVRSFNQFFGPMDAQAAFSYDGKRFFRGRREPLLAVNPIPDHGCAQVRPSSVVVTDTEIRIYSEAHRYGHGRERGPANLHDEPLSAMVLHTLRRDGFMFVRPRGHSARMLSKPFSLRAPQITASVDARYGEVRFQLTNLKSEPLPGLTFEDCEPIRGVDEIERSVRWKTARLDNRLRQPLRLELQFSGANVYGLRADWQWLDAQGVYLLEDGKPVDHLLEL